MHLEKISIKAWHIEPSATRRQLAEAGIPTTLNISHDVEITGDMPFEVSESEIERRLSEDGIVKIPTASQRELRAVERIDVSGKPLSEMIIEERR